MDVNGFIQENHLKRRDMTMTEITEQILAFRDARDWRQFHTPNHLAAAIAIEASELQEHFLWKSEQEVREKVADAAARKKITDEVADVLILALLMSHALGADPSEIVLSKLADNAKKYPVEKARGTAAKYTEL